MGLFEAIVIYLACGSPFAVYRVAVVDIVSPRVIAKSLVYLVCWPATALRFVVWQLPKATFRRKASILEIRNAIEEAAIGRSSMGARLRFRDAFDEFVAFATASESVGRVRLFYLSNHPDPNIAEAIARRETLVKIESGLTRSRIDLVEILYTSVTTDPVVSEHLLALSSLVSDSALRRVVLKLSPARAQRSLASQPIASSR